MAQKLYIHLNGQIHGVVKYTGTWTTTACGIEAKTGRPSQEKPYGDVCKACFRKGAI